MKMCGTTGFLIKLCGTIYILMKMCGTTVTVFLVNIFQNSRETCQQNLRICRHPNATMTRVKPPTASATSPGTPVARMIGTEKNCRTSDGSRKDDESSTDRWR